jgi:hypothetical protein
MRSLLLATCMLLTPSASATSLGSLCLQPHDVPKGFVRSTSRALTNSVIAREARMSLGLLAHLGRITGYETRFRRNRAYGLYLIQDDVSAFTSIQGAAEYDALRIRAESAARWGSARFRAISGVRVGDHASAWSASPVLSGLRYTDLTIFFRRGRFEASVSAVGYAGTFSAAQVVTLARTIDARLGVRRLSCGAGQMRSEPEPLPAKRPLHTRSPWVPAWS